jgi:hypothetical protein
MDVSLLSRRVFPRRGVKLPPFLLALFSCALISCGNRYDLSTAAGQQSRIDDANGYLSKGDCANADAAISPLYASPYATDQVVIIKASVEACYAHFNLLTFAANMVGATNYFQAVAKSLDNNNGDAARSWMYAASDVLTSNGANMNASMRTTAENSYMVFIQLGVISAILRNYGNPDSLGVKHTAIAYNPGAMSDIDACALTAAFSILTDSFTQSDLSDTDSKNVNSSLNQICTTAGLASCQALNRDRNACGVVGTPRTNATLVVTGVNGSW